jgi:hypothetical protein
MPRAFACLIIFTGITGGAFSQSTNTPIAFEAADVHVSAKAPNAYMTTFFRAGRYEARKATMLDLIRLAYGVDSYKISGGPGSKSTGSTSSREPPSTPHPKRDARCSRPSWRTVSSWWFTTIQGPFQLSF